MEEAIDLFKYNLYLGKLELLKGKKKPVQDFIREVYALSNDLKYYAANYSEQPETYKYAFMLITKAMTYDTSVNPVKYEIRNQVVAASNSLIDRNLVNKENIAEVYEYYTQATINFYPKTIEQLYSFEEVMEVIGFSRFSISFNSIEEFKQLEYNLRQTAARMCLLANNPNSTLGNSRPKDATKQEKVLKQLNKLVQTLQGVLDDSN